MVSLPGRPGASPQDPGVVPAKAKAPASSRSPAAMVSTATTSTATTATTASTAAIAPIAATASITSTAATASTASTAVVLLGVAVVLAACAPDLADDTTLVTAPRVLAVRAEPAEAAPGAAVTLTALWTGDPTAPAWSFCATRRPIVEVGSIDPRCLAAELPSIGTGLSITAALPDDGCALFGPDQVADGRPVDPDGTGGYYQPIRVLAPDAQPTAGFARIICNLAGATPEQALEYRARFVPNTNPAIAVAHDPSSNTIVVDPTPETFVYFDPTTRTLADRAETIRVSWFATAGAFDDGAHTTGTNTWRGDTAATIFIVVRDDRGGVTWESLTVHPL